MIDQAKLVRYKPSFWSRIGSWMSDGIELLFLCGALLFGLLMALGVVLLAYSPAILACVLIYIVIHFALKHW